MKICLSRVFMVLSFALTAALAAPATSFNPAWIVSAQPAVQDTPVTLGTVRVDIWPEYDQPSVLVIYNISTGSSVKLPATMSVRIPAEAKIHAVATAEGANLYNLNYQTSAAGSWTVIKFTTPLPDVRIEYYDSSLKKNGSTRDFTFSWPGDYTVDTLSLVVQQPINATGMTFRPSAGPGQVSDGLTYYTIQAGKVNAGTTFDLAMSYQKPDDSLTNPSQFKPVEPNQPVDSNTQGRVKTDQAPWIIGGAGLLLIAAGLIWYWRTGRSLSLRTEPASRPRHGGSRQITPVDSSPGHAQASDSGETVFCNQCGKKAGPGDVFCRSCGTRLG